MVETVLKRDGTSVPFDKRKIETAILKAFVEVDEEATTKAKAKAREIANYIAKTESETLDVEEIQDVVEEKLMATSRKDVAKAYTNYRFLHSMARDKYAELMDTVKEKITASNVQNQNANVDEYSFGGRVGEVSDAVLRQYALEYCMSPMSRANHENNEIYIHDLNSYANGNHNCADGSSWITIKHNGDIKTVRIESLANDIGLKDEELADLDNANYQILSRDGWTKLNNISKRKLRPDEKFFKIKARTGLPLNLTEHHRLPVIEDGHEVVKEIKDLKIGDELISADDVVLSKSEIQSSFLNLLEINDEKLDIRISNLSPLKNYLKFKYGVTFAIYARENFETSPDHGPTVTLNDFLKLIDEYPMSFEVLSKLKIKSNGSKHSYPLLIPYTPQLAKLYAYIYSDGSVYVKEDGSLFQMLFTNTNEEIVDDFIDCFEAAFGRRLHKWYPPKDYEENNSPCIRVFCGDRIIVSIFKEFAGGLMCGSGNLKIPDFIMNGPSEIKYAYLSAAIDSDGCICNNNTCICTCCKNYADQIVLLLESLGYHATTVKQDSAGSKYHFNKSNRTGTRNFDSYQINIYREDEKYDLYTKMNTVKLNDSYSYHGISNHFVENKIMSIEEIPYNADISVYDIETASHWFILNDYISHNCLSIPFDKLLANGFNTRQTDVRPAQSVSTAFQLVAVIFQLQSLQQFGGVSATHLDWTMVPYVRKSFNKYFRDGAKYIAGNDTEIETKELPIDDDYYKTCGEQVYQYAMDMTEREVYQAVEGMYHNLNIRAA